MVTTRLSLCLLIGSTFLSACGDDEGAVDEVTTDDPSDAGGDTEQTTSEETDSDSAVTSGTSGASTGSSAESTDGGIMIDAGEGVMMDGSSPVTDVDDAGSDATIGPDAADGGDSTLFTVTIENVAPVKAFTSSGVFNTPMGDSSAGPATPGKRYEFTINAGRKQKLSFATMLAATNDLFFGPNGDGIALYDEAGVPLSGDVTDQISLWDVGTEINEEPKVGPNTVSQQENANTGPAENGNVVEIGDTEDPFDYPSVAEVMTVTVTHVAGTEFLITIENVSSDSALQTSEGDFPAPLSPGVWVVHNVVDPLFTVGMPDRGQGLEHIAEDGNPSVLGAFAEATSGITYPASPGVWVVHSAGSAPLFMEASADYGDGVEHIAEDGNPTALGDSAPTLTGYLAAGVFNTPVGSDTPGPIRPGSSYEFSFAASPGEMLSFASMLAATNDAFFAPTEAGIALFDDDANPVSGDITSQVFLWDVGTEGNEEPGIGPNTVTNQLTPDTGTTGEGMVSLLSDVNDGYTYPDVDTVLKVTISVQ